MLFFLGRIECLFDFIERGKFFVCFSKLLTAGISLCKPTSSGNRRDNLLVELVEVWNVMSSMLQTRIKSL